MNICGLFILLTCTITLISCEYPRYSHKRPNNSVPPKFHKKWHHHHQQQQQRLEHMPQQPPPHPQRFPVRSPHPPIPVHMPISHKIPMGVPPAVNRPIAPPVRTFWKNTQNTFKAPPSVVGPIETSKPLFNLGLSGPQGPDKSFLTSPKIRDYDYHLQTNSIPPYVNSIQQTGEKGPIYTIPAPNLGPADKPLKIIHEEQRHNQMLAHALAQEQHQNNAQAQQILALEQAQQYYAQEHAQSQQHAGAQHQEQPGGQETTYVQIQKAHQYQVTEAPENFAKFLENQQFLQDIIRGTNIQAGQQKVQPPPTQQQIQDEQQFVKFYESQQPHQQFLQNFGREGVSLQNDQTVLPSGEQSQEELLQTFFAQQMSQAKELYEQQVKEGFERSTDSQHSPNNPEKIQFEFQPEFHNFGYEEKTHQQQQQQSKSLNGQEQRASYVTAGYNLEPSSNWGNSEGPEIVRSTIARHPSQESNNVDHSQFSQKYFDTAKNDNNVIQFDSSTRSSHQAQTDQSRNEFGSNFQSDASTRSVGQLQNRPNSEQGSVYLSDASTRSSQAQNRPSYEAGSIYQSDASSRSTQAQNRPNGGQGSPFLSEASTRSTQTQNRQNSEPPGSVFQSDANSRSSQASDRAKSEISSILEAIEPVDSDQEPDFFSSLPNKEAADRLANLQEAGKFNSDLNHQKTTKTGGKSGMTIFVPDGLENSRADYDANEPDNDSSSDSNDKHGQFDRRDSSQDDDNYDDFSTEELSAEEDQNQKANEAFGQRLRHRAN